MKTIDNDNTNSKTCNKINFNKKEKEHIETYFAKRLKKTSFLRCSISFFIFIFHLITPHFAISDINPETVSAKKHKAVNISRVWNAGKNISITFDGGANASSARQILKILKKNKIKTTFFLSGLFINKYRALTRKIVEDGHEVGNHTFTHPHLTTFSLNGKPMLKPGLTYNKLKKELDKTAQLFKDITGRDMSPFWRAPYGEINGVILKWASQAGYQHIAWTYNRKTRKSMDSLDWVSDRRSPLYHSAEEIKKRLTSFIDDNNSANGGIVLMHLGTDRKKDIVHEKLDEIINSFIAKGYEIVTVSQLIKMAQKT